MHSHCFAQYTRYNYSCPICSKSMGDMSIYFGMLDSIVARDLADLPQAYRSRQQVRWSELHLRLHVWWAGCRRAVCPQAEVAEHSDKRAVAMYARSTGSCPPTAAP